MRQCHHHQPNVTGSRDTVLLNPSHDPGPRQLEQQSCQQPIISNHLQLSFVSINCGSGGLQVAGAHADTLASLARAQFILLSETHTGVSSTIALPHYTVFPSTRLHSITSARHIPGGVAIAVRNKSFESSPMPDATVEVVDDSADIDALAVTIQLSAACRPLLLVSIYLPPATTEFCCTGEHCLSSSCQKSHVNAGLQWLVGLLDRYTTSHDIIVAGDFNANAQHNSTRWRCIQQYLAGLSVSVFNPIGSDGRLCYTRSQGGSQSVLDLVIGSTHLLDSQSTITMPDHSYSDHYPILTTVAVECVSPLANNQQYVSTQQLPGPFQRTQRLPLMLSEALLESITDNYNALLSAQSEAPATTTAHLDIICAALVESVNSAIREKTKPRQHPYLSHQQRLERNRILRKLAKVRVGLSSKSPATVQHLLQSLQAVRAQCRQQSRQWHDQWNNTYTTQLEDMFRAGNPRALADLLNELGHGQRSAKIGNKNASALSTESQIQHLINKYGEHRQSASLHLKPIVDSIDMDMQHKECDVQFSVDDVTEVLKSLNSSAVSLGVSTRILRRLKSDDFIASITAFINHVWNTAELPESFGTVQVTFLHKSGSITDPTCYRSIGFGSSMSRVFEGTVHKQLLEHILTTNQLSELQYGFMPNKSTLQCVWLSNSMVECLRQQNIPVFTVFLDLKGAFPSVQHYLLLQELVNRKFPASVYKVMRSWLRQQQMFVRMGPNNSVPVRVFIGVTEGGVSSPLLFNLLIDRLIRRLESIAVDGFGPGDVPTVWFADDGRIFATSPEVLQQMLDICGEVARELLMEFNVQLTKTVWMYYPPCDYQSAHRLQPLVDACEFTLSGASVPRTDTYKHLGIHTVVSGRGESLRKQLQYLLPAMAKLRGRCFSSSLRFRPLLFGVVIHRTRWMPTLTHGLHLLAFNAPPVITKLEGRLLRSLAGVDNAKFRVLRCIFGIPSFDTQLELDRWRFTLSLVRSPPNHIHRCRLQDEFNTWTRATDDRHKRRLWYHGVAEMFARFRELVCEDSLDGLLKFEQLISHADLECTQADATWLMLLGRTLLLQQEAKRRTASLDAKPELAEVADLLNNPSFAPFISAPRGRHCDQRLQLWGGIQCYFRYQYQHVTACPHCQSPANFTVPHLIRDCPAFEQERLEAWARCYAVAQDADIIPDPFRPAHDAQHWYRLTLGASVPHTFLKLHLDAPTHFARPIQASATAHVKKKLSVYRDLLHHSGDLINTIMDRTATVLQDHFGH